MEPSAKERIVTYAQQMLDVEPPLAASPARGFFEAVRDEFQRQVDVDRARAAVVFQVVPAKKEL